MPEDPTTVISYSIGKRKPGPKPKPLEQSTRQSFRPPVKRVIKTRSREEKLAVLHYWKHGLVADEAKGGNVQRPVALKEVALRYQVCEPRNTYLLD